MPANGRKALQDYLVTSAPELREPWNARRRSA